MQKALFLSNTKPMCWLVYSHIRDFLMVHHHAVGIFYINICLKQFAVVETCITISTLLVYVYLQRQRQMYVPLQIYHLTYFGGYFKDMCPISLSLAMSAPSKSKPKTSASTNTVKVTQEGRGLSLDLTAKLKYQSEPSKQSSFQGSQQSYLMVCELILLIN